MSRSTAEPGRARTASCCAPTRFVRFREPHAGAGVRGSARGARRRRNRARACVVVLRHGRHRARLLHHAPNRRHRRGPPPDARAAARAGRRRPGGGARRQSRANPRDPSATSGIGRLPLPAADHALATISEYRAYLDTLEDSYPGLEWAIRWCETHAPEPSGCDLDSSRLSHRQLSSRRGSSGGCARLGVRRLGRSTRGHRLVQRQVLAIRGARARGGGLAAIEPFLRGYESVAGRRIDRDGTRLLAGDGASALGDHRASAGAAPRRWRRALAGARAHGSDRP